MPRALWLCILFIGLAFTGCTDTPDPSVPSPDSIDTPAEDDLPDGPFVETRDKAWTLGVTTPAVRNDYLGGGYPQVEVDENYTGLVIGMEWDAGAADTHLELEVVDGATDEVIATASGGSPLYIPIELDGSSPRTFVVKTFAAEDSIIMVNQEFTLGWATFWRIPFDPEYTIF